MHVMLDKNKIIAISRLSIRHINDYIKEKFAFLVDIDFNLAYCFYLLKEDFMLVTRAEKKSLVLCL